MKSKLLIVLAVLMLAGCRTDNQTVKTVELHDIFSLRDMPGDDGCVPGTYSSPYIFKGKPFYAVCVDATEYH